MSKDQRKMKTLLRLIRFGIILSLSLFIALSLYSWTKSIGQDKQRKELAVLLKQTVEQEGVEAILSLSGVAVENIFHGEEGLILFEGSDTPWRYSADELQTISVYEKVNKSVVNITTNTNRSASDFLDVLPGHGTGSGIVLSSDGYILTNAHVVEGAETIMVGLYNNQTYQATLVGVDSEDDLAVLKIDVGKDLMLYPIALGTSSELRVGQKVIAIGNPFGYDRTMTIGVVSGLNRPVRTAEGRVVMNAIQTDASINPGNSGGPLLNSRGEVIGINSSIFSTSGSSQGINFAIPIDTAVEVVGELIRTGKVSRGWIDASMLQLTPRLVEYAKLPISQGVLISQLAPGGNAEKAGLKGGTRQVQYGSSIFYLGGDIIVAIDNEKVEDLNGLYLALLPKKSGEKVAVTVNRSGEVKKIDVVLIERTMSHIRALVR
ncbi:MAG TPA: trypsin-like peptidase domain-containing protein [Sphaerochaeta sp.]|nr:trypsin-like peptidase domain-containing protein [Sphaerochaeta sp.]HQB04736.1 trypsin-like peptidase domain-containing protein [Sphaerochaeta sp.]